MCQGGEKGDQEGKPNPPFESGFFELRVWGKFLWILIRIYIPHVWGFNVYIYAYIFHSIWKVFNARKVEMEEPSKMVFKLEAEAKLF